MPGSAKILAFVLAGGQGTRLHPLTAQHAKPALPFLNGRRIVDFVLSNLLNSAIALVYVLAQYKPQSLVQHLQASWASRFAGAGGFISTVLPPEEGGASNFRGTADAVYRNRHLIDEHEPNLVAVFAADHIYRMDVRQMVEVHLHHDAEVTIAATPVPIAEASSFGVIVADECGRVLDFEEKPLHPTPMPGDPARAYASMGNYLFRPDVLHQLLEDCVCRGGSDFGRHVMPHLPRCTRTYAYDFSENHIPGLHPWEERGYWRDVGSLDTYRAAQLDLANSRPRIELANPQWPIRGERWRGTAAGGALLKPLPLRDESSTRSGYAALR